MFASVPAGGPRQLRLAALAFAAAWLVGCGGGSGAADTAASERLPELSANLSEARVALGHSATLSWSSTDTTSCDVAEVAATALSPNGSLVLTPTAGGRHSYTVRCEGPGGAASQVLALIVPMPVLDNSYDNKNSIAFDETRVPTVRALGIAKVVATEQDSIDRSVAFADFFQEGGYAAYVMAGSSDGRYGADKPGNLPGIGYFLGRDASGRWVDRSAELFRTTADRMGCISPSYAAVADFNHDGRPDVYVACTGLDFAVPGATAEENQAFGRSHQILVLSQPDGSYKSLRIEESNPLYGHKAVAFDIDRDGHVDVVTTDFIDLAQPVGCGAPYVLRGRGDGTFVRDYRFIDGDALRRILPDCGMFNVDMVPIAGRRDLVVGGLARDGAGASSSAVVQVREGTSGHDFGSPLLITMPTEPVSRVQAQFPLDILFDAADGSLLFKTPAATPLGANWLVVKADSLGQTTVLDSWLNLTTNLQPASPQFKPSSTQPGVLLPYSGGCASDLDLGDCGRQVRVR